MDLPCYFLYTLANRFRFVRFAFCRCTLPLNVDPGSARPWNGHSLHCALRCRHSLARLVLTGCSVTHNNHFESSDTMLTALYCRGFVLPALSSQPCAHGLVPIVLGSGLVLIVLGSWSYSPGLILQVLFFQSYSSGIISWPCIRHRADLDLMLPFGLAWSHIL